MGTGLAGDPLTSHPSSSEASNPKHWGPNWGGSDPRGHGGVLAASPVGGEGMLHNSLQGPGQPPPLPSPEKDPARNAQAEAGRPCPASGIPHPS